VRVEWHGHNDRGLAVINSLAALKAGANVVHGLRAGHRRARGQCGHGPAPAESEIDGLYAHDLSNLTRYVSTVSAAVGVPIPKNYPLCGEDAVPDSHRSPRLGDREGPEDGRHLAWRTACTRESPRASSAATRRWTWAT